MSVDCTVMKNLLFLKTINCEIVVRNFMDEKSV